MAIACSTRLESAACHFLIERRAPSLVVVRIDFDAALAASESG